MSLIGFSLSVFVHAEQISIDRIMQSPSLSGAAPRSIKMSPDGQRVTFLRGKVDDYERYDL